LELPNNFYVPGVSWKNINLTVEFNLPLLAARRIAKLLSVTSDSLVAFLWRVSKFPLARPVCHCRE
jgi:hypothetical protein